MRRHTVQTRTKTYKTVYFFFSPLMAKFHTVNINLKYVHYLIVLHTKVLVVIILFLELDLINTVLIHVLVPEIGNNDLLQSIINTINKHKYTYIPINSILRAIRVALYINIVKLLYVKIVCKITAAVASDNRQKKSRWS